MFVKDEVPFYEAAAEGKSRKRLLIGIAVAVGLGVALSVGSCVGFGSQPAFKVDTQVSEDEGDASSQDAGTTIYVHVLGCVVDPGVYAVDANARVYEAIEQAGGMTEDACAESVNLAGTVADGTQINVLSQEQVNAAAASGSADVAGNAGEAGKININTASEEQLQTLEGVGASTAQKIVAYRKKNGRFTSIEDLMNVSGIGEKKYEALKDHITV